MNFIYVAHKVTVPWVFTIVTPFFLGLNRRYTSRGVCVQNESNFNLEHGLSASFVNLTPIAVLAEAKNLKLGMLNYF